jgi:uncharacterized protein YeaO (DUF488 family)
MWPRGISRAKAHVDLWARDIAPSNDLREWYQHDPTRWREFGKRYQRELKGRAAAAMLGELVRHAKRGRVTLVYASHASDISNAAVLERLLKRRLRSTAPVRRAQAKTRSGARARAGDASKPC